MTDEPTIEPLWTPADVSAFLVISEDTLTQWRHKGTGPAYAHVGKHVRYRREVVQRWVDDQVKGTE